MITHSLRVLIAFWAFYLTAYTIDYFSPTHFSDGEIVVCAITCALIAVGLALGWVPGSDPPGDEPKWMRGRRY